MVIGFGVGVGDGTCVGVADGNGDGVTEGNSVAVGGLVGDAPRATALVAVDGESCDAGEHATSNTNDTIGKTTFIYGATCFIC
jgi:hypothetical protein